MTILAITIAVAVTLGAAAYWDLRTGVKLIGELVIRPPKVQATPRAKTSPIPPSSRITLLRGDKIVLSHPGVLHPDARACIQAAVDQVFPGHQIIVLEEGMSIAVVGGKPCE